MDLLIKGFKNKEEVDEFVSWYSGQGEESFSIWLESSVDEGKDVRDFIPSETLEWLPLNEEYEDIRML